jgi:large subunit ribosomal protein L6
MSRIGKKPIVIPAGVEVTINGLEVTVKGPKGTLTESFSARMSYELTEGQLLVKRPDNEQNSRMLHGTTRAIINNMITGVTQGFSKTLLIQGIGYAASIKGTDLVLKIGFANPVVITPADGVKVECIKPTEIRVSGIDSQKVGQQAAVIRQVRKPEPYHGKGIRYSDEKVLLRVSKAKKKESAK